MRTIRILTVVAGLFAAMPVVHADTLLVNAVRAEAAVDRPRAGMSMDQVLRKYGEPVSRSGAVGDPPITAWTYNNFIAYFEYQRLIHAVVPR